MPNWTSNTIRAEGAPDDLREFLETVRGPATLFDFNRIIPMPELLRRTGCGGRTIDGRKVTSWYVIDHGALNPSDEQVRLFTPEEEAALADIGYTNWYDWAIEHWGTKWNAGEVRLDDSAIGDGRVSLSFDTAWAAPFPIFRKMAAMFPALAFEVAWTDEDEPDVQHVMKIGVGDQP